MNYCPLWNYYPNISSDSFAVLGEGQKVNLGCVDGPIKRFLFITAVYVKTLQLRAVSVEPPSVRLHNEGEVDRTLRTYFQSGRHSRILLTAKPNVIITKV